MVHTAELGWYKGRQKVRVPVDGGVIRSAMGGRVDRLRVEHGRGIVVLTDLNRPGFFVSPDEYLDGV